MDRETTFLVLAELREQFDGDPEGYESAVERFKEILDGDEEGEEEDDPDALDESLSYAFGEGVSLTESLWLLEAGESREVGVPFQGPGGKRWFVLKAMPGGKNRVVPAADPSKKPPEKKERKPAAPKVEKPPKEPKPDAGQKPPKAEKPKKVTVDEAHQAILAAHQSGKPVTAEDVDALGKVVASMTDKEVQELRGKMGLTKGGGKGAKKDDRVKGVVDEIMKGVKPPEAEPGKADEEAAAEPEARAAVGGAKPPATPQEAKSLADETLHKHAGDRVPLDDAFHALDALDLPSWSAADLRAATGLKNGGKQEMIDELYVRAFTSRGHGSESYSHDPEDSNYLAPHRDPDAIEAKLKQISGRRQAREAAAFERSKKATPQTAKPREPVKLPPHVEEKQKAVRGLMAKANDFDYPKEQLEADLDALDLHAMSKPDLFALARHGLSLDVKANAGKAALVAAIHRAPLEVKEMLVGGAG